MARCFGCGKSTRNMYCRECAKRRDQQIRAESDHARHEKGARHRQRRWWRKK